MNKCYLSQYTKYILFFSDLSWLLMVWNISLKVKKHNRIPSLKISAHVIIIILCFPLITLIKISSLFARHFNLKGQCHEIFCFWFFSWISFPPAPEYPIRTVFNFFENSLRYSQVKVCHRYQRHWWQICHRCQRRRRQFAAGINDTGGKFCYQFP